MMAIDSDSFNWFLATNMSGAVVLVCQPKVYDSAEQPYTLTISEGGLLGYNGEILFVPDEETINISSDNIFTLIAKLQNKVIKLRAESGE